MVGDGVGKKHFATPAAMFIQFSALAKPHLPKAWKPWADELLRLTHHGIVGDTDGAGNESGSIRHDLRLSLAPGRLKSLQTHLSHSKDRDLAVSSSGALAVLRRHLPPEK